MVAAVVLEYKPRRWIVDIGPADEPCSAIAKIRLHLWLGQTSLNQKPTKPSFHWRLSGSGQ
jgi:hypothetical protein